MIGAVHLRKRFLFCVVAAFADFTMNTIMDAVRINMSLLLKGSTPDAEDKIKSLVFDYTTFFICQ